MLLAEPRFSLDRLRDLKYYLRRIRAPIRKAAMGRQVGFYAVHSEFRTLLRYAQDVGLLAMPRMVATDAYDRRGHVDPAPPLAFSSGTKTASFYLVPGDVPPVEIFYHELRPDPAQSYLASHVSPVIEIAPCCRQGDKLYHSRIYINAPRQGPGSDLVYQAYERLARYIKKWPEVAEGNYVGPITFERLRCGEIRLMVFSRQLQVDIGEVPPRRASPRLEWIEIPAGKFTRGLTDEQRADIAQRLYTGYGIAGLPTELQTWIEATLDKPRSAYSLQENEIWKREVLKVGSPALAYQHALWALDRIPPARQHWLPTFYISRFPITCAQAASFYTSDVAKAMGWHSDGIAGDERPRMFQLWDQAQALAHWLGGRLPTPLEWEKAARGTEGWLYPWGDEWNPAAGHFRTSECHIGGDPQKRTGRLTAVDAYPAGASPYGVMDMVGNLSEWHALTDRNDVGSMGFSIKEMRRVNPWFYALPMHRRGAMRQQTSRYIGCRPVLEEWGHRLWPGHRPETTPT
jgi:formylglycine-generating enzyme required for sulfatase activity